MCRDADEVEEHCRPRCVTIEREGELNSSTGETEELSYDCEVGFYKFHSHQGA